MINDLIIYFHFYPENLFLWVAILSVGVGSFLNVLIFRYPIMLFRGWIKTTKRYGGAWQAKVQEMDDSKKVSGEVVRRLSLLRQSVIVVLCCSLSVLVAFEFQSPLHVFYVLLFTWLLIIISGISYDHSIIPDELIYILLWTGLLINMQGTLTDLRGAVIGCVLGYIFLIPGFYFSKLFNIGSVSSDDMKLLSGVGAWVGFSSIPVVVIISSMLYFGHLIIFGYRGVSKVPYAVFVAASGWLAGVYSLKIPILWFDTLCFSLNNILY